MTVATLSEVLSKAKENKYAVAGLVVLGWEDARCYAETAEELGLPIILTSRSQDAELILLCLF